MGTTRIKVIDLSGEKQEIKTSRKHAEKLTGVAKLKASSPEGVLARREEKRPKPATTEDTEVKLKAQKESATNVSSVPSESSVTSVIPEPAAKAETPIAEKAKKSQATTKAKKSFRHQGKKYLTASKLFEKNKFYPAREAIDLLYKTSITRFDPAVEIHLNVTDKNIRGSVNLPHVVAAQKEKKYLVFADKKPQLKNKQIILGDSQTIDEIESGKLKAQRDFDVVIAQPKFMPKLAKIAKLLGPHGLMPNPKNNTIVENVASALERASSAAFEYKSDPSAPIIHTKLGKLSYKPSQIEENLKTLIFAIGPTKIKKATIATTMGPGIKVDLASIT